MHAFMGCGTIDSMIKIAAEDLARVCNNAMMFANPKSLYLPGEILFLLNGDMLEVFACDDYFAITDSAPVTPHDPNVFVLGLNDIKGYTKDKEKHEGLEEFARKAKKDDIRIVFDPVGDISFASDEAAISFENKEYRENNWDIVEGLIYSDEVTPVPVTGFRSNPERYAKLSQLKYDKANHGIEWKFVQTQAGHLLVRFEIGPTLKGVIRPLENPKGGENDTTEN